MTTSSDTFARFVDTLASNLDDHDADGAALAARAYLSRFHFDRVVAAAAGETPARFRRRVLLERSAYRLVTSDRGVLDIALADAARQQEDAERATLGVERRGGRVGCRERLRRRRCRCHRTREY